MKNLKNLVILAVISVGFVACSEGNYTPTPVAGAQQGLYGNQAGFNNGYPQINNNIPPPSNPYFQAQNGGFMNFNAQAQMGLQFQANAMFNCQYRQTPLFYYSNYNSNNCAVRTQPTYTPTSCACYQAPCNCAEVINQVRSRYVYRSTDRSSTRSNTTTSSSMSTDTPDGHASTDQGNSNSSVSNTTSTQNTTPCPTDTDKTLLLSINGEDAKALYQRLSRETEELKDHKGRVVSKIRTGINYKCMTDKKANDKSLYACDIDISKSDGKVFQQDPVGKLGTADLAANTPYSGPNLMVGSDGMAQILITGRGALDMFKRLPGEAKPGTLDADGKIHADIKLGKQIKCYKKTDTATQKIECIVKVNADLGEAVDAI